MAAESQRLRNLVLQDLSEDVDFGRDDVMLIPFVKMDFRASGETQTCHFGTYSDAVDKPHIMRRQMYDLLFADMGAFPSVLGQCGSFASSVEAAYYHDTSKVLFLLVRFKTEVGRTLMCERLLAEVSKGAARLGLGNAEAPSAPGKTRHGKRASAADVQNAKRTRSACVELTATGLSGLVPVEHLSQNGFNSSSGNWHNLLVDEDQVAESLVQLLRAAGATVRVLPRPPITYGSGDSDDETWEGANVSPPVPPVELNKQYGHSLVRDHNDFQTENLSLTLHRLLDARVWHASPVLEGAGLRPKLTISTSGGERFGAPREFWRSLHPSQLTELRHYLIPTQHKYFARYCAFSAATPHPDATNRESDIARLKRFYEKSVDDLVNAQSPAAREEIRSDMVASVWMLLQTSEDLPETFVKARKLLQELSTPTQTMHTPNGGKGYTLNKYWNLTGSQNTYLCLVKLCETDLDVYHFHHFGVKSLLCYLTINERAPRCSRIHTMNGGPGGVGKSYLMEQTAGYFMGFAVRSVDYASQQVTFVHKAHTDLYDYQVQITDEAPEELVNGPGCRQGKSSFETTAASKLKTERSSAAMQNRVLNLNKTTGQRDMLQLSTTVDHTAYNENSNAHLNNMNPALKSRYNVMIFHATKRLTERPFSDAEPRNDSAAVQMFTYKLYFLTLLQALKILPFPNLSGLAFFMDRFRKVVTSSVMFDDSPGNIFTPRFNDQVRSIVCNLVNLSALAQVFLDEGGVHTKSAFFDPGMLVDVVPFVRPTEHDYVMAVSCLEHKLFHPYTRHIGDCLVEHFFAGSPEAAFEERASRFDAVIRDGEESSSDAQFRRDYVFVTDFAGKREVREAIVELANVFKYRTDCGKAFNVDQCHYESNLEKMSGITQKLRFCFANHSVYVFASRAFLMEIVRKEQTFIKVLKRTVEACPHSPTGRYITMEPLLMSSMEPRMDEFRGTTFEHLFHTVIKPRLTGQNDLSVPYLSSYFDVAPCGLQPPGKPAHGLWTPAETYWPQGPCTAPGCWRCALRGTPSDVSVIDQMAYAGAADEVVRIHTKVANEALSLPPPHATLFFKPGSLEKALPGEARLFTYPGYDLDLEARCLSSLEGPNRDDAFLRKHHADVEAQAETVKRARSLCALANV